MPFYDYECEKHGVFEVFQSMTEEHKADCPVCHKDARRLFAPSALHGLPSQDQRMGKTREELFQNLGKEGLAEPDMWKYDANQRDEMRQYQI